jgi:DNA-directed RNA polymerase specialized sigma24 family protein
LPATSPSRFEQAQPHYTKRIRAYARRHFTALPGTDACELEQELLEVLWLCCLGYDPNEGAKFNTYFWYAAERRFLDLHKAASRQKRVGDYERIALDADSIREALAGIGIESSAEDEALARIHVREEFRSGRRMK